MKLFCIPQTWGRVLNDSSITFFLKKPLKRKERRSYEECVEVGKWKKIEMQQRGKSISIANH